MATAQRRLTSEAERDEDAGGKMGFLEHLDEFRTRLIRSCVAIAAGMAIAFAFVDRIGDFVLDSALSTMGPDASLQMVRPGEGLSFYFDLALMGGVILAAPFVAYQVWRFIAPGLYAREKRLVIPFVLLATLATVAGAVFSHYVLFPSMMAFFRAFDSPRLRFTPRLEDTFVLYRNTLLGMVVVFQIPSLIFLLARMRLVTARGLWRHVRYAVLAIFVVAAVLTPSPDPWNQTIFAAPMIALYLVSIVVAWVVAPRRGAGSEDRTNSRNLKLVFAAAALEHARRRQGRTGGDFPRLWNDRGSR